MAGINKVILIGHLGRDPEIKHTVDGTPVANFSIATSEEWTDKNSGEKVGKTEWHRIVVWRKLAELSEKYLFKGSQVYIEGKLQTRSWENDGVMRYMTEVIANQLQFLSKASKSGNDNSYEESLTKLEPTYSESGPDNNDIPF